MKRCAVLTVLTVLCVLTGCKEHALPSLVGLHSGTDESCPVIISPAEGAWFAINQAVTYCWQLPDDCDSATVTGYEVQFSNTPTPDGPWDAVRTFTETCWHYAAGHQCVHEALYWRVRIVFADGSRSRWAVSYHEVG